jgi:octaprenyl-diphosphate synthase
MLANEKFPKPNGAQSGSSLFAALAPHMQALDAFLDREIERFEPEVRDMVRYCLGRGGKRLRPSLVFFSGWQGDAAVSDELVKVAAVIELVHLATLVHDDILDSAAVRHGRTTASRKFGADTAVLLGDALFAHAVNLSTDFQTSEVCRLVSLATRRVCSGEIAQNARRGATNLSLEEYFRLIELKTAELFKVSCFLGARLGGYDDRFCQAVGTFGLNLGTGYQVYDDLADFFGREEDIGKTLGTDLAGGKFTLPVILLFRHLDDTEKKAFLSDARSGDEHKVDFWLTEMTERGVAAEVVNTVVKKADDAEAALLPFVSLPPSPRLMQLTAFLKERTADVEAVPVKH